MTTAWWDTDRAPSVKHHNNMVNHKYTRRSISLEDYTQIENDMKNNHNDIILSKDLLGEMCLIPPSKVDISFSYDNVKVKSRPTTPAVTFPETIKIPTGEIPETRNPPPTPTRKLSLESVDLKELFSGETDHRFDINPPSSAPRIKYKIPKVKRTTPVIPKTDADFVELPHTPTKYPTSGSFAGSLLTCRKVHQQIVRKKRSTSPPSRHLLNQTLDVSNNQLLQARKRTHKTEGRSVSRLIAAGKWDDYNKSREEQKTDLPTPSPPLPDVETKSCSMHSKVEHSYTPIQHMRQSSAKRRNRTGIRNTPIQNTEHKERNIISPDIRSINYRTSGSMEVLKSLEETLGHMPPSRTPYVYFRHNFADGDKSQKFVKKWLAAGPTNISFANK